MELCRGAFALLVLIYCCCSAQNLNSNGTLDVPVNDTESPPAKTRIIGGSPATKHQFPYQVAIIINGQIFCGGSLISSIAVLTAAHCTNKGRLFEVRLGAHLIMINNEADRQIVMSTRATQHASYGTKRLNFDIAIVHLPQKVSGKGVAAVRLPSKSQSSLSFQNNTATVSGWGLTELNAGRNNVLLYVKLTVIANIRCRISFGNDITENHICTDSMGGTEGTCNGDSGGPLVITDDDGNVTLIGIVSFGATNCMTNAPSVYTRVTSYLDWIEENKDFHNKIGGGTRQFSRTAWLLPVICITYKILI